MVAATWSVQVDFSQPTFGAAPTWTDVTSYALGSQPIRLTYGGQDETGVQPRTCSLLLDNADGRFTPDYASSPYAHPLDVGMRLRVSCVVGGTTYYRFDGFVTDVEASFDGGGPMSMVAVTAQDILGKFGNDTTPLYSLLSETILFDSPYVYLPLTDDVAATTPGMLTYPTGANARLLHSKYGGGSYAFATGTGPVAEGSSALVLTQSSATQGYIIDVPFPTKVLGGSWSVIFGVRLNWTGTATAGYLAYLARGGQSVFGISLDGTGKPVGTWGTNVVTGPTAINDGKPHDLALLWDPTVLVNGVVGTTNARVGLYVDGTLVASTNISLNTNGLFGVTSTTFDEFWVGGAGNSQLTSGTYSHAAVLSGVTANPADHYNAGANGLAGELTSARFSRLLGYRTNTGSTVGTGQSKAGNQSTAGLTLAEALKQVGDTEGTPVVVDGQGNVVFRSRLNVYTPPTTCTLDASQRQVGADIRYRKDTQTVVNDVTIDRYQASSQRVQDTTSQTTYGPRQRSVTTVSYTDRDALDNAGWNVAVGKTAKVRMPSITVDLLLEPTTAVAQSVLASTILGTVTATNLPAVGSPATSLTSVIQGWQEQIGVDVWSITFFTSPTVPNTLYADATATSRNLLDSGLVVAW